MKIEDIKYMQNPAYHTDNNITGGIRVKPENAKILDNLDESFFVKFNAAVMKKVEMKQKETFGCPDRLFKYT